MPILFRSYRAVDRCFESVNGRIKRTTVGSYPYSYTPLGPVKTLSLNCNYYIHRSSTTQQKHPTALSGPLRLVESNKKQNCTDSIYITLHLGSQSNQLSFILYHLLDPEAQQNHQLAKKGVPTTPTIL